MHTVLENDSDAIDMGNVVMNAINNGVSFFTPELVMEKFVKDYRNAEELYGPTLVRRLAGFDPGFVSKNMNIPEFRRELEKQIKENLQELKEEGILTKEGTFSDEALELATIVLAVQELDHLSAQGMLGKRVHKKHALAGTREDVKPFTDDPYRAINIAQSVKTAIRRGHSRMHVADLRAFERQAKGKANIMYALDASGSMKGAKLTQAKRAGVALAYKAIQSGDNVGLVIFEKDVQHAAPPGKDFPHLLSTLARLRPGSETDISACIHKSMELFTARADTNHLILLTDALPTVGSNPEHEVLSAVAQAANIGITISVIGIALDAKGEELAQKIVDLGKGRLSIVKNVADLDVIILEEYERSKH